jgi:hypothetical protein
MRSSSSMTALARTVVNMSAAHTRAEHAFEPLYNLEEASALLEDDGRRITT